MITFQLQTEYALEAVAFPAEAREVDRQNKVIRGVKILGMYSKNRRRYTAEAMEAAVGLYEGTSVNVDHPEIKKIRDPRGVCEQFGWLENVRYDPAKQGVFGDLHYFENATGCAHILEQIERRSNLVSLSHNADLAYSVVNEPDYSVLVHEISKVRSVDLVTKGGTTAGMFESEGNSMVKTTASAVLESVKTSTTPQAKDLGLMLTNDPSLGGTPCEVTALGDDNAAMAAYESVVSAVMNDSTVPAPNRVQRLANLVTPKAQVVTPPPAVTPQVIAPPATAQVSAVESQMATTLQAVADSVAKLSARMTVGDVLARHGLQRGSLRAEQLAALESCASEVQMEAIVASWPPVLRGQTPIAFLQNQQPAQPQGGLGNLFASSMVGSVGVVESHQPRFNVQQQSPHVNRGTFDAELERTKKSSQVRRPACA